MSTLLDELKKSTVVVADTGDFEQISEFKPQDATTNPSLILAASQLEQYKGLVAEAVKYGTEKAKGGLQEQVTLALDRLAVLFGLEILKIIPGRVSTEIDARLSFDTAATVKKGEELIEMYEAAGLPRSRVLLKIASTYEGLLAAKQLEAKGMHTNLTLLFSIVQAMVAGEVGVTLISPFAGRITDFYKSKEKVDQYEAVDDPGVKSVKHIYNYLKAHGYATVVMGASFRNKEQVMELRGCDLLTVSPKLLAELKNTAAPEGGLQPVLSKETAASVNTVPKTILSEAEFRRRLNDDEMAHFKLGEGIRRFTADVIKLENQIREMIEKS